LKWKYTERMKNSMDINLLKRKFNERYGSSEVEPEVFFAPGRVNLIGEHTDYNMGYVLPCTLSYGTYLLIRRNNLKALQFTSGNFNYTATVEYKNLSVKHGSNWVNYPLGVINQLNIESLNSEGYDMYFHGDVPNGAGLSSSASIELATAFAFNELTPQNLTRLEMALLCQKAENEFVGMKCGIMDQFAVALGKKNSALFIDCSSLEYSLVPVIMDEYKIIITNTNKIRKLTDSKYNERRSECQVALSYLNNNRKNFKNLSELDVPEFEDLHRYISDENIKRRARHIIYENARVREAVSALKGKDLRLFGQLMNQSHESLKNDYEVSCRELDILVSEAQKCAGVLGSRMTGAGFGGCTVSIVAFDKIENFKQKLGSNYFRQTGIHADFYDAEIGDGVGSADIKK
jgi:galactokinase